jgi:hypothetical protein
LLTAGVTSTTGGHGRCRAAWIVWDPGLVQDCAKPRAGCPTACPTYSGRSGASFAGMTVAVLGADHSAIGTLTDLTTLAQQAPGTRPIWLLRGGNPEERASMANDKLSVGGELGAHLASSVSAGLVQVEVGFPRRGHATGWSAQEIATSPVCCGRSIVTGSGSSRAVAHREALAPSGFGPRIEALGSGRRRLGRSKPVSTDRFDDARRGHKRPKYR